MNLKLFILFFIFSSFLFSCSEKVHEKKGEGLTVTSTISNAEFFKGLLMSLDERFEKIICINPHSSPNSKSKFPVFISRDAYRSKIENDIFSEKAYLQFAFIGDYENNPDKWMRHYRDIAQTLGLNLRYDVINATVKSQHIYTAQTDLLKNNEFKVKDYEATKIKDFTLSKLHEKGVYHFYQKNVSIVDALNSIDHFSKKGYLINNISYYADFDWEDYKILDSLDLNNLFYNFEMALYKFNVKVKGSKN